MPELEITILEHALGLRDQAFELFLGFGAAGKTSQEAGAR